MNLELKKAIFLYMAEHHNDFQLINITVEKFRQYIYTPEGEFCYCGKEVQDFIVAVKNYKNLPPVSQYRKLCLLAVKNKIILIFSLSLLGT
jgi:hypothetical protein